MVANVNRQIGGSVQKLTGRSFVGIVTNNNDPLKCERVQARVRGMYGNTPDTALPWIGKKDKEFTGAAAGIGSVSVPPIGAKVMVEFEDDSPYHGRYFSAPATTDVGVGNTLPGYPNVRGFSDEAGNQIYITTVNGNVTINILHVSGTTITINNTGDISALVAGSATLNIANNLSAFAGGNIEIDAQNITFKAAQNITFNGQNINLISNGGQLSLGGSSVLTAGSLQIVASGGIGIGAGGSLQLAGSSINRSTDINQGGSVGGVSPASPTAPVAPMTITPRTRPVITFVPNNFEF